MQVEEGIWRWLARQKRPIVLYGMGNGADKILEQMERCGISASGVCASDEFVRGHSFRGFPVRTIADAADRFGHDMILLIAFGSSRPELLARFEALQERYTVRAPDVPVVSGPIFDEAFFEEHAQEIGHARMLLADEQSRLVFDNTVQYKLSGKISFLTACQTQKKEIFGTVLRPGEEEHFVDLGAYTGDTIRELLNETGGAYASILAMEPDRRSFRKLKEYAEKNLSGNVRLVQAGAWDRREEQPFSDAAGRQSRVGQTGHDVQMLPLDEVLAGEKCTLLKMDVEGAEARALSGARQTIQKYRPRLNIAAYHRSEDFFRLPLMIHEMCPDYRLYLRHHPYVPAWDTNLYAACP